jgi:hypothetical protein
MLTPALVRAVECSQGSTGSCFDQVAGACGGAMHSVQAGGVCEAVVYCTREWGRPVAVVAVVVVVCCHANLLVRDACCERARTHAAALQRASIACARRRTRALGSRRVRGAALCVAWSSLVPVPRAPTLHSRACVPCVPVSHCHASSPVASPDHTARAQASAGVLRSLVVFAPRLVARLGAANGRPVSPLTLWVRASCTLVRCHAAPHLSICLSLRTYVQHCSLRCDRQRNQVDVVCHVASRSCGCWQPRT